jgi:PEP-CTERM motif
MKFRLTLWLGGVALVAVLPAWADGVHYSGVADDSFKTEVSTKAEANAGTKMVARPGAGFRAKPVPADPNGAHMDPYFEFAEEPPNVEVSARVIDKSSTKPTAPANAGFPIEDAPPALTENLAKNAAFEAGGSTRSVALDMLFFSSSSLQDTGIQSRSLSEPDFHESISSIADTEKEWHSEREGDLAHYTGEHRRHAKGVSAVSVPEPGSFSLLLLGLAGIGFLGLRRV